MNPFNPLRWRPERRIVCMIVLLIFISIYVINLIDPPAGEHFGLIGLIEVFAAAYVVMVFLEFRARFNNTE